MSEASANQIIRISKLCAQVILENGGETYRAEETVQRICRAFGFDEADVIAIPTGVFITLCGEGNHVSTAIKRIKKRSFNLTAIEEVNNISRMLIGGGITATDALEHLNRLNSPQKEGRLLSVFAAGMSSGCFTLLFRGSLFDFAVATMCGMLVQLVASSINIIDMFNFAISILGGIMIAVGSVLSVKIFGTGDLEKIITGAMMPLLPGIPMTNAIRDAMRGDLVSGVTRATEALLVAVALAFGVGVVLKLYYIFL
ncbi:MAG TPA: threonine/serine exporter family protein [Clostridia bacterium]|nr:threonine/serine exporter family protein [Clostridia bacterium]